MANIYDMSDTWNASGTTFTAIKMDVTDTDSAADSLLMDLQVGGASKFSVTKDAGFYLDGNLIEQRNGTNAQTFNLYNTYTDASNYERARFQWVGNELRIGTEASGTGSIRSIGLYIGNTRYQIIGSGFNQFDQNLYMNGANIATGSGASGFKIGTATTQGLGFWNATPSAQPAAVADATDAASVITQLNALLSRMRTIGLIAT
jgi:hypothetical protein